MIHKINLTALVGTVCVLLFFLFHLFAFFFSNYHAASGLEDYSEDYSDKEESEFSSLDLALKVMPSYNFKGNAIFMQPSKNPELTQMENSKKLQSAMEMAHTFYFVDQTRDFFPTLEFTSASIPVGSSVRMCTTAFWSQKLKTPVFERMDSVDDFPVCDEAANQAFIWNEDDTKNGIDVPVWVQEEHDIDCADKQDCTESCKYYYNGLYFQGKLGKKCYSYKVLDNICILIQFNKLTNRYSYKGGCFEDGSSYTMKEAEPETVYEFNDVKIEIRNYNDPIVYAGRVTGYDYGFGNGLKWTGRIVFYLFVIGLILLVIVGVVVFLDKKKEKEENSALMSDEGGRNKDDLDLASN